MTKLVSWNSGKLQQPWYELVQMARDGDVDLALSQETGSPPEDLVGRIDGVNRTP